MSTDVLAEFLQAFKEQIVSEISETIIERLSHAKTEEEEGFMSSEDACKLFTPAITRQTLHSWAKKGLIANKKIGSRVWYRKSDIMSAGSQFKKYHLSTN